VVRREAFAAATVIAAVFLSSETVQTGTRIPTLPKKVLPSTKRSIYPVQVQPHSATHKGPRDVHLGGGEGGCKTAEVWS
jgi:hypothetical protein